MAPADAPLSGRIEQILTSVAVLLAVLMVILDMTVVALLDLSENRDSASRVSLC